MNGFFGKPLVNKKNILYLLKRLSIYILIITIIISIVLLVLFWKNIYENQSIVEYIAISGLKLLSGISILASFVLSWFLTVFFFFRLSLNLLKMHSEMKPELPRFKFFDPLYGWRKKEFTEKGIYYRTLVIDGFFGFAICLSFGALAGLISNALFN
ncbi:MAG: hypothetical protein OEW89_02485 [Gammaproteobacteria bacterium]|nr:hypothetical protein [Gammaproteobacteria bacterium]MDH5594423.1 hypothetical protein [Gammaproteobacteria bacterium]